MARAPASRPAVLGAPVPELAGAAVLFLVCVVPYLVLGQDAYVLIHDNLDAELVYLTNLVRSGTAFAYGPDVVIPNVMDGLPRSALRSGLNVTVVLFHLFDPFVAYVANALLVRAVAFVGMLLLLRRHLLPEEGERWLAAAIAVPFALLPFYSLYGVSVTGQPLLLWAYLEIARGEGRWWHWTAVGLFAFWSLLYLSGIFVLAMLGAYALVRCARERRLVWPAMGPVLVLAAAYIVVEWPLIRSVLGGSTWTSHRVEMERAAEGGNLVRTARDLLRFGHYHAAEMRSLPIGLSLLLAAPLLLRGPRRRLALALAIGIGMLLIAILHAIYAPVLLPRFGEAIPVLGVVQLDRFYFLLPFAWFALFALALASLRRVRAARWVVPLLLALQAEAILSTSEEVRGNALAVLGTGGDRVSFREFFAPELFASVKEAIGLPPESYRVVSVGLHPAIAQYNGLFTLDSYQNNYPLDYKHRFRAVIAPELDRDRALARYFDAWGSRCYVLSSELERDFRDSRDYLLGKDSGREIADLAIDVGALRALGGTHVLSSVPVRNHEALGLHLVGAFERPDSHWRIHLYELYEATEETRGRAP